MPDNSDVNPINSINPIPNLGTTPTPDPTGELNSIGNQLWLATYFLFHQPGCVPADQATFGMAMAAIQRFIAYCNANPAVINTDPYLQSLWNELETKDGDNPQSLADLANTYTQSGFSQAGLNAFNSFLQNPQQDINDIYNKCAGIINQWGSKEGGYKPNPQSLNSYHLLLLQDSFSHGDYATFLYYVNQVNADLKDGQPPLDGVSQSLSNLLNMPLDTNGDTLVSLAGKTPPDTQTLQTILNVTPNL